ncbi:hypothetical protein PM082_007283 [Marasmius tenuissimus]|nr:hypothetical protein PM082_007283 [Marasmius tenuissimus]
MTLHHQLIKPTPSTTLVDFHNIKTYTFSTPFLPSIINRIHHTQFYTILWICGSVRFAQDPRENPFQFCELPMLGKLPNPDAESTNHLCGPVDFRVLGLSR